jgi:flavodoxin
MKTAVVFYSYEGNCSFVAQELKTLLNADLMRLHLKNEKKRSGLAKYFWGGGMVLFNKHPGLKPYSFDLAAYDLIILGVPVWAGSPAPPIQSFLSQTVISGKKLALFVCHAGGKGNALKKFRAGLADNTVVSEIDFANPLKQNPDKLKRQIQDWVNSFSL